ncbi:MAG TPA: hypothetical protein PKC69_01855 [Chitinophagaceae bacterium]|nr:hypothetical protein [Chitinophagaceae bacterium]
MKFSRIALLLSLILANSGVWSQRPDSAISLFNTKYSSEKVHIHYDKALYNPGDTLWFKSYIISELAPATSKNLYIDFIDSYGKILKHITTPVAEGVAFGQFEIPEKYAANLLYVHAYTRWMLNFDSSFIYSASIPILKAEESPVKLSHQQVQISLAFYPEGGSLVNSLTSRIAFKAADQLGYPATVEGFIAEDNGDTLTAFKSAHNGMGLFYLTPEENKKYFAFWKDSLQNQYTTPLPVAATSGAALQMDFKSPNRNYQLTTTAGFRANNDSIRIIGTMYKQKVFSITHAVSKKIMGSFPVDRLPSGLLTFTVFNKNSEPVLERATYVLNDNFVVEPKVEIIKKDLSPKGKNEILITLGDSLYADLSISVTDLNIYHPKTGNIVSQLMLAADMKEYVHDPGYYFEAGGIMEQQLYLDLVTLTHEWNKPNWHTILSQKKSDLPYGKDDTYLSVTGKVKLVKAEKLKKLETRLPVLIKPKNQPAEYIIIPLEEDGTFKINDFLFYDSTTVTYRLPEKAVRNYSVSMSLSSSLPAVKLPLRRTTFFQPLTLVDSLKLANQMAQLSEYKEYLENEKAKMLKNVTVTARAKSQQQLLDEKYARGSFTTPKARNFHVAGDEYAPLATNILTYLRTRVPGLMVSSSGNSYSLQWRGLRSLGGSNAVDVFIDEMPSTIDIAVTIPMYDIAYVKAISPPFVGSSNGSNGAIVIYTRHGDEPKHFKEYKPLGYEKIIAYDLIRPFYHPDYSGETRAPDYPPDFRTTLYWNPSFPVSPEQESSTFIFYNSSTAKGYHIKIEGITRNGQLVYKELTVE